MLRLSRVFWLAVLTIVLGACAGPRRELPSAGEPPPLKPVPGAKFFQVEPEHSLVRILVFRAGTLAQAGHNHVIASHEVTGKVYLHENPAKSAFELTMPVATLTVDEPELRQQEGEAFSAAVPESARHGTRENLLGAAVLDGAHYPEIRLVSTAIDGAGPHFNARMRIGVKGHWSELSVPITLQHDDRNLTATGEFAIKQTALGLEPFSVMLGALKVQDEMTVKFSIAAVAR